jgi:hypothetical protein
MTCLQQAQNVRPLHSDFRVPWTYQSLGAGVRDSLPAIFTRAASESASSFASPCLGALAP